MTQFLALYGGRTVNSSEVLAVTADPRIVGDFASRLLEQPPSEAAHGDKAATNIEEGRRNALRVVRQQSS